MKRRLRVGLLWHTFGHPNLGVDALARANSALIRRAAAMAGIEIRFITLGTPTRTGIDVPPDVEIGPHPSIRQALRGRSRFLAEVRNCDMVFDIGEGDSFTDLYGARRFVFQAGTKLAVLATGRPLVLSPQTIGPFAAPYHRALATTILRRAKAVHTRDHLSTEFAEALGVRQVKEFTDTAFALPYEPPGPKGRPRIAINVSGLLYAGGVSMRLDYRALTHSIIEAFSAEGAAEICLFAHVNGTNLPDTDEPAIDELARRFPQTMRIQSFTDSTAAKTFIAGVDFVVAARMHAAIAAFSTGGPVVPIAYSRKVNGLFAGLDYPHFVDAQSDDLERATATILAAFQQRQQLAQAVAGGRRLAEARLDAYVDELALLLDQVVSHHPNRIHEPA